MSLPTPPRPDQVEAGSHKLLPLYYDMTTYFEAAYAASQAEEPVDRGRAHQLRRCRFSLLPTKGDFTVASIPICGRAMASVLTRVRDSNGVALSKTMGKDAEHDAKWRSHFNVNLVETASRRFGGVISTDGYAVSVHLLHMQARVLSTINGEWDPGSVARENR